MVESVQLESPQEAAVINRAGRKARGWWPRGLPGLLRGIVMVLMLERGDAASPGGAIISE